MSLVLASQSPRRRELLHQIGIDDFKIIPSQKEEKKDPSLTPKDLVMHLSRQKAEEVAGKCSRDDIIIAADTVVSLKGQILGKPKDREDGARMLSLLSGNKHEVFSGVAVKKGDLILNEYEETAVYFREMTEKEISWYLSTGEPMDKAGAYGIQGIGIRFISRIEGDYSNVVGLPICRLLSMLEKAGWNTLKN